MDTEDIDAIASSPPVFVDDTGRRRALTRRAGRILLLGFVGYLGLLGAGFARDPRLGPLALPTFGLPALHPEPAPVVLGQTTGRTAAEATDSGEVETAGAPSPTASRAGVPSGPTGGAVTGRLTPLGDTAGGRPALPPPAPASGQGSTTTTSTTTVAPTHPGNGPKSTTTTTTVPASSTTSPTTPPPTSPTPGQGFGAASAKGPDGTGPPGQDRQATTPTTQPKR